MASNLRLRRALGLCAASLLALSTFASNPADATGATTTLRLKGGDRLVANAWHCGTYVRACGWKSSAKLLGTNPSRARWITNRATIEAHGLRASLSLSRKGPTVRVTGTSRAVVRTVWTNTNAWISDSAGEVRPGFTTAYVSVRSVASASHPTFGTPSGVTAYAGAF
jgi:hypothetical protein